MITADPEQGVRRRLRGDTGVLLAGQTELLEPFRIARTDHVPRPILRFFPPVNSHPSEGRMTSAPTATSKELVINASRVAEYSSRRSSHSAGPRAQSSPQSVGSAG